MTCFVDNERLDFITIEIGRLCLLMVLIGTDS
jgi:hypothetical protein